MHKNHYGLQLEKNALVDEGNGVIKVKGGLVLTDESTQRNGTQYEIKSLDISEYDGTLFANHGDEFGGYTIETVIGKLMGVTKKGKKVVAEGIDYAVKAGNALAIYAYNMTKEGYLNSFSIGTRGGMPDDNGLFKDHQLYEVSQVGIPNNRNAKINQIALNSIEQAKEQGLDTSELEQLLHVGQDEDEPAANNTNDNQESEDMKYATVTNDRDFDIELSYKNAAGAEVKVNVAPGATLDVSEDQKEAVENQIKDAKAPEADLGQTIADAVSAAVKPLQEQIEEIEKNRFDAGASEPEFTQGADKGKGKGGSVNAELNGMDYKDRHVQQIEAYRRGDVAKLVAINKLHVDALKKEGLVANSMTIEDMGNFVISPELLTEIQGCRTDYAPLVDATEWRETLSTQMAWLERSGDIDMQNVEFCADEDPSAGDPDANLKPISEYGATPRTADLEELAAVTPVCNAATRFLAVDLLSDVAAGYRNDYDRKRAQLVVARLEQAVDFNGNDVDFDVSSDVASLTGFLDAWSTLASCTPNGTFVMSQASYAELIKRALSAGVNGPLAQLFTTGNQPTIFGRPYILVSNDLLPTLGTNDSVSVNADGESVSIDHAVFYSNLSNFTGRISGGLQYDLSRDAAYEIPGEGGNTVRSAFQRNEIVLRGSFFRGGAVKDRSQVSGLLAPAVS